LFVDFEAKSERKRSRKNKNCSRWAVHCETAAKKSSRWRNWRKREQRTLVEEKYHENPYAGEIGEGESDVRLFMA
jgi:hypothetical protein